MTTNARTGGGIYYGWVMMGLCMVALMLTIGSTLNAFGLYVLPVSEAFGLSRATANTGMILMNAGAALASLVVGRLLDRYSARVIMGASGLVLAASLVTLGLSQSLWLSAAVVSLPVGFAMAGIGTLTAPALMARWFQARRARAMAITMMGMSLGTVLVVPPLAWSIDALGWRQSLMALGAIVGVVISAMIPFVRNAPGPNDRETDEVGLTPGAAPDSTGAASGETLSSPLKSSQFWVIALCIALAMAAFQGTVVSLVPIGHAAGFTITQSASLISALGIAGIAGKFGVAAIADRFDRVLLLVGLFVLMASACLVLLVARTYPGMVTGCLMLGLAAGAAIPLYLALLADRFGSENFGSANGYLTFMIALASAGSVRFSGEVFDRTGGYDAMFYTFATLALCSTLLMASSLFRRPLAQQFG